MEFVWDEEKVLEIDSGRGHNHFMNVLKGTELYA